MVRVRDAACIHRACGGTVKPSCDLRRKTDVRTLHVCASQRVRATFSVCDLYTPRPARSRENSRELAAMRDRACAGKKCFVAPPGEPLGGHWAHSRASAGAPRPRYTSRHLLASVLQREVGEVVASPTQNLGAPSAGCSRSRRRNGRASGSAMYSSRRAAGPRRSSSSP